MNDFDQELHPVIEAFVCDFAEGNLDSTEFSVFSEVLYHDKELEKFALSARKGYHLLSRLRQKSVSKNFDSSLEKRISKLSGELHS